jgi:ribosomal protein L34E
MASHVDDPTLETPGNYTTIRDVTSLARTKTCPICRMPLHATDAVCTPY